MNVKTKHKIVCFPESICIPGTKRPKTNDFVDSIKTSAKTDSIFIKYLPLQQQKFYSNSWLINCT